MIEGFVTTLPARAAASSRVGADAPDRSAARVARHDIVRGALRCRGAGADTMSSPARPGGGRPRPRMLIRIRSRKRPRSLPRTRVRSRVRFRSRFRRPRPSGPPSAFQRRTIGMVARRKIEGLRPRRWPAGGLLPNRSSRTGTLCREGCPAAPLCGSFRVAGRSFRHNGVPGTPR